MIVVGLLLLVLAVLAFIARSQALLAVQLQALHQAVEEMRAPAAPIAEPQPDPRLRTLDD